MPTASAPPPRPWSAGPPRRAARSRRRPWSRSAVSTPTWCLRAWWRRASFSSTWWCQPRSPMATSRSPPPTTGPARSQGRCSPCSTNEVQMKFVPVSAAILFAVSAMAQSTDPVWVPGSSQKVCQLVGEFDHETGQPTASHTESNYGLSGNDLGSSFEHNGKLWFLFGDTHPTATFNGKPNLQTDPPRVAADNDSVGFTSGTNIDQCLRLDFVRDSVGAYQNPVVLNAQGKPAITLGTDEVPIAGVDVGGRMFVVFGTDNNVLMPVLGNLGFGTRSAMAVSDDDGN